MKCRIGMILFICLCVLLTACGKNNDNLTVNCVSKQGNDSFSSHYDLFSGEREYSIKVGSKSIEVEIEICTESGSLSVSVAKDGQSEYTGNDVPTSEFSLTLDEPGTYKVLIKGDNHKGGYSFEWE